MKKQIFLMVIFCVLKLNAQINMENIGKLKKDLSEKSIFDVMNNIRLSEDEYKFLYNDNEIKEQVLKAFDQKKYFEYEMEKSSNEFKEMMLNDEYAEATILGYLKDNKRGNQFDSIRKIPELLQKYKDTIIQDRLKLYRKDEDFKRYYPQTVYIGSIARFKYPEVYVKIKEFSKQKKEQSKNDNDYNENDIYYFELLLNYNDPEAQESLVKKIDKYLKEDKEVNDLSMYNLVYKNNLISLQNFPRILGITRNLIRLSHGDPGKPVNCWAIEYLSSISRNYLPENLKDLYDKPCKEQLKYQKEVKKALNGYILEVQKEQEYWMKNMPFYEEYKKKSFLVKE